MDPLVAGGSASEQKGNPTTTSVVTASFGSFVRSLPRVRWVRPPGARNGARCPTDPSRSPRSSISRKPLETVPHVVQRDPRVGLITRRSQVRILPPP
jgi:hypothetical protein